MDILPVSALSGLAPSAQPPQPPRDVGAVQASEFRELMASPECAADGAACDNPAKTEPPLRERLDMDIEKVLMAHMPSANASPAEFAVGLLRAQVKVSQAAIAIEMVSKTTQSLSQGVQTLTTRS